MHVSWSALATLASCVWRRATPAWVLHEGRPILIARLFNMDHFENTNPARVIGRDDAEAKASSTWARLGRANSKAGERGVNGYLGRRCRPVEHQAGCFDADSRGATFARRPASKPCDRSLIVIWLRAPADAALRLHRPVSDDALQMVAIGERQDNAPELAA